MNPSVNFISPCFYCSFHSRGCVCAVVRTAPSLQAKPGQTSQYRGLSLFFLNCLERARLKPAEPWAQGKYGPVALLVHRTARRAHTQECIHRLGLAAKRTCMHRHTMPRQNAKTRIHNSSLTHTVSWGKGEGYDRGNREIEIRENLICLVLLFSAIYYITH